MSESGTSPTMPDRDREIPRLFRKSALRSASSGPQHLTLEPANGKPPQQPNAPATRPGVVVATRFVLACGTSSPARCVPCCTPGEQVARRVNKVTKMGCVAAPLQHKVPDGHPSSTALVVIYLQITTFRSGADGVRTHALRCAKALR